MATLTGGSNRIQSFSSGTVTRNRQIGLAGRASLATLVGGRPGLSNHARSGWLPSLARLHRFTLQRSIDFIFARRLRRHAQAGSVNRYSGAFDSQESSFSEEQAGDLAFPDLLQATPLPVSTRILRRNRPLVTQGSLLQARRAGTQPQEFEPGILSIHSDLRSEGDTSGLVARYAYGDDEQAASRSRTGFAAGSIFAAPNRSLLPFVYRSWIRRERAGARENAALETGSISSTFAASPAALQNYANISSEQGMASSAFATTPAALQPTRTQPGSSTAFSAALFRQMHDEPGVLPGLPSMLPNAAASSYALAGQLAGRAMPLALQTTVQRHALTPAMILRRIARPVLPAEQPAPIPFVPGFETVQRSIAERAVLGDLPQILPRTTANSLRLMSGVAARVAPLNLSTAVRRELATPASFAAFTGTPDAMVGREFYTPTPQEMVLRRMLRRSAQTGDGGDTGFARPDMPPFGTTAQAGQTVQASPAQAGAAAQAGQAAQGSSAAQTGSSVQARSAAQSVPASQIGSAIQASPALQTPIAPPDRALTGWGWSPLMTALVGADRPVRMGRSEVRQSGLQRQPTEAPASGTRSSTVAGSSFRTEPGTPTETSVTSPLTATGFAQLQSQPLANAVLRRLAYPVGSSVLQQPDQPFTNAALRQPAYPFTNAVLQRLAYPLTPGQERASAFVTSMSEDIPSRYTRTQTANRSLLSFVLRLWRKPERTDVQSGQGIEPAFANRADSPRQFTDATTQMQAGVEPLLADRAQRTAPEVQRSLTERAMLGDMPLVVPQAATGSLRMMEQIATRVAPLQLRTTVQRTLHAATPLMMLQRRLNRLLAEPSPETAGIRGTLPSPVSPETAGTTGASQSIQYQTESPSLRRTPDATIRREAAGESAIRMPDTTPPGFESRLEPSQAATASRGNRSAALTPATAQRAARAGESATGIPAAPDSDRVMTGWGWSPLLSALLGSEAEAPAVQRASLRAGAGMVRQPEMMASFTLSQEYLQLEPVQRVLAQRAFRRRGDPSGELADSSFAQLQAEPAIGTALTGYHTPAAGRTERAVLGDLPGVVPQAAATSLLFMNRIAERVAPAEVNLTVQRLLNLPAQAMVLQRMLRTTDGVSAGSEILPSVAIPFSQPEQGMTGTTSAITPAIGTTSLQRLSERRADAPAAQTSTGGNRLAAQPPSGGDRMIGGWGWSPVLSMLQAAPAGSSNLLSRLSLGQTAWGNFDPANRTFANIWRRLFMQQSVEDAAPPPGTPASPVQRWFAAPQAAGQIQSPIASPTIGGDRADLMRQQPGDIWGIPTMTMATAMLRRSPASSYAEGSVPADLAGLPSATQLQLWSAESPVATKAQQQIASPKISGDIAYRMLRREWGGSWDMPAMTMATAMLRRHVDSGYVEESVPADFATPPSGKPASAELAAANEPLRSVEPFQHVDQAKEAQTPSLDRQEQIVAYARAGRLPGAGPAPSWSPSPVVQRSAWNGTPGLDFEATGAGKSQEREAQTVEADIRRIMYGEPASVGVTYGKAAASTVRRAMAPTPGRASVQRDESKSTGSKQVQHSSIVQLDRNDESSSTTEPDLDTLARQVYSAVKDRLAIERERMNTNSGWLR